MTAHKFPMPPGRIVKPATDASVEAIEAAARRKYEIDPDEGVDLGASDALSLIARLRQEQEKRAELRREYATMEQVATAFRAEVERLRGALEEITEMDDELWGLSAARHEARAALGTGESSGEVEGG